MNNFKTRIKNRLLNKCTAKMGFGPRQSSIRNVLANKYAEAQKWIDTRELEFMSLPSARQIANALNSVSLPKKKSWFGRIFGA